MPHTFDVASQIGIPRLGWGLTNQNIADVLTFIRNSWGNEANQVTVEHVAKVRGSLN